MVDEEVLRLVELRKQMFRLGLAEDPERMAWQAEVERCLEESLGRQHPLTRQFVNLLWAPLGVYRLPTQVERRFAYDRARDEAALILQAAIEEIEARA